MGFIELIASLGTGVLSFFGGTAFRMVWGELSSYLSKRQEHKFEIQRMTLQNTFAEDQHRRNLAAVAQQADLQVKVIRVAAEGEVDKIETAAWGEVVRSTTVQTGIWLADAINALIRPLGAVWSIYMLTATEYGWLEGPLSETTANVCFAFIGLFVADRTLGKRGK